MSDRSTLETPGTVTADVRHQNGDPATGLVHRFRDPPSPHSNHRSLQYSLVVLGYLIAAYWFTGWILGDVLSTLPDLNFYLVQPLVWGGLAFVAYYGWRRLPDVPAFSATLTLIAAGAAVFSVAVLVVAGLLTTFGDSPTAGKLLNYPKNALYFSTLLLGAETARAFLYHAWKDWNRQVAFGAAAAVLWVVAIPAAQWTAIDGIDRWFDVVAGLWLPTLAVSVLATWLASLGGLGPGFVYRWVIVAFVWLTPRIPDLPWFAAFVVGVFTPFVAAVLIRSIYEDTEEAEERGAFSEPDGAGSGDASPGGAGRRWPGWLLTGALALALVLFFTGTFGVKPITVDGISMEPAYERGDIAIVRTGADPTDFGIHDVITFERGGATVIHRIVAIDDTAAGLVFTTKGDNVAKVDQPVLAADVKGKVVFLLPEIGRIGFWLRGSGW
jgi:signal peptidase